jgi:hypothetical protein
VARRSSAAKKAFAINQNPFRSRNQWSLLIRTTGLEICSTKVIHMNLNPEVPWKLVAGVIASIVITLVIFGVRQSRAGFDDKPETKYQRLARYYKQSEAALDEAVTNSTGFRRSFRQYVHHADENLKEWYGSAEFEFINKLGGVERTNAYFTFHEYGTHISAYPTANPPRK